MTNNPYDSVRLRVKLHQQDSKSYLFSHQGKHRYGRWVPKDKVRSMLVQSDGWYIIEVPRWLANDRNFPPYEGVS